MVVGGPNSRNDYHVNQTEEWFYQIKGAMKLKVINENQFEDVDIKEGEMFLLPANVPHNPCRFEDTIGLVMERKRPQDSIDRLRWFCPNIEAHNEGPYLIREVSFHCTDLGTQLKPFITVSFVFLLPHPPPALNDHIVLLCWVFFLGMDGESGFEDLFGLSENRSSFLTKEKTVSK
ncbi:hypothetical protein Pst134EB_020093 [Puccinia striiformis f. sp. tritici]|uniref:3-hydroxyanthranilate 3,4-dioxygenase n=1 Tax=Puccinia striiformis f. sp. tritici PST-78 TaxID=1165861 RepID=A0A0L0W2I2_9BASI|nr:hypothetical protein Pst134EB_020093 [Puccinia striiformis f. sp. tritici]KNF05719.1 hypothetical protein PSTG_01122 [Puccinia striiformis f. sp. tritici PST-78]